MTKYQRSSVSFWVARSASRFRKSIARLEALAREKLEFPSFCTSIGTAIPSTKEFIALQVRPCRRLNILSALYFSCLAPPHTFHMPYLIQATHPSVKLWFQARLTMYFSILCIPPYMCTSVSNSISIIQFNSQLGNNVMKLIYTLFRTEIVATQTRQVQYYNTNRRST